MSSLKALNTNVPMVGGEANISFCQGRPAGLVATWPMIIYISRLHFWDDEILSTQTVTNPNRGHVAISDTTSNQQFIIKQFTLHVCNQASNVNYPTKELVVTLSYSRGSSRMQSNRMQQP